MSFNLDAALSRVIRQKTVVTKLSNLGITNLGELLWCVPRRIYRWGELTRFDQLSEGANVTVFGVVMDTQLGWTARRDKAMLTVTLCDELADCAESGNNFRHRGNRMLVRFFAKHPDALKTHLARLQKGTLALFAGKLNTKSDSSSRDFVLTHPEYQLLQDYDPEVAETISTKPQPLYHATSGLPSWKIAKLIDSQLAMISASDIPEAIPDSLRLERGLPSAFEALTWLHHPDTEEQYYKSLDYLCFREALTLGAVLAKTRNQIRAGRAVALNVELKDGSVIAKFIDNLPFELTLGQSEVWRDICSDLKSYTPMNRLLQGDVGSGKTVIAALTALAAVQNKAQAALMAPTEVLAFQHYETLKKMLGNLVLPDPDSSDSSNKLGEQKPGSEDTQDATQQISNEKIALYLLTGSTPNDVKKTVIEKIESGKPLFVVGTHTLVSKSVSFPNLAVAIVDEQHRFGVEQRVSLLSSGKRVPHYLATTATPIPRTVAMSVFGDLDISFLRELPPGRAAVQTFLVPQLNNVWMSRAWKRAAEEIRGGGRVYVVCPKITDSSGKSESELASKHWNYFLGDVGKLEAGRVLHTVERTAARLRSLPVFSGINIAVAHSGLDSAVKQRSIDEFVTGKSPLLVSTTVVEVGLDVPEATMMVILDADRFGLSQLHQLRGRIGRGNRAGLCLAAAPLNFPDLSKVPSDHQLIDDLSDSDFFSRKDIPPAVRRLVSFAGTRDGFILAEADLAIRREGDILGSSQAGYSSRLQVLSLQRDAEVIKDGKTAAFELVAADPELSSHPELARLVFALGQAGNNLVKS